MSLKLTKIITILLILNCPILFSQEKKDKTGTANTEFIDQKERKNWTFKLAPYAWLAGTATDVGGEKIRQSFNDLSSLTNFGMQIIAQVKYKKWSLSSNFTYAKLGDNIEQSIFEIEFGVDQIILDTKLGYSLIDKIDFGDDIIRGWAMDVTVGGIYWVNDVTVIVDSSIPLPEFPIHINDKQKWTDLVIGTNFRIILSKSVFLGLSANIGGFGIGNSSDLYYDLTYVNTFKVSKLITITAGYKTFDYKRVDGSGVDELKTHVKTFGPLLRVAFNL